MHRTVYLVVDKSPLFPAHWSLWIPHTDDSDIGKRIHATEDAASGFEIAFERNYNIGTDSRSHQVLRLAFVSDHYITDVKGDGSETVDHAAHDHLEQIALSVLAPEKSLISAATQFRPHRQSDQP